MFMSGVYHWYICLDINEPTDWYRSTLFRIRGMREMEDPQLVAPVAAHAMGARL